MTAAPIEAKDIEAMVAKLELRATLAEQLDGEDAARIWKTLAAMLKGLQEERGRHAEEVEREVAAAVQGMKTIAGWRALREIGAERTRQMLSDRWAVHHDDELVHGELAGAAACYALDGVKISKVFVADRVRALGRDLWPWRRDWWKPSDHRRNLVKAGALVLAEIERIDRLKAKTNG